MKTGSSSKTALIVCFFLFFITGFFYYPKWKQSKTEATISWDVSGYYIYLPAIFIYKDLKKLEFKNYMLEKYGPTPTLEQAFIHPGSGNYVFKYSSGQAIMLSPFFLAGHLAASMSNHPADGYSFPYQLSISIGAMLYAFLGLYFLRRLLLQYYSEKVTAITLICFAAGTNYLNYAAIDGAMTHNTLFFVYALLACQTISFYKFPSWRKALLIGFLTGLATITRPTEIISILIPLLWGVGSMAALSSRKAFIIDHIKYFIAAALVFCAMVMIQLGYWKYVSGEWLVYSYRTEKFSFLRPHVFLCMFSYRCGWLVYSPMLVLALFGFIPLFKKSRPLFFPVAIFLALFTYLCFAWDIWWYGGSFGQRAMVQSYPLYALPFAACIDLFEKRKIAEKLALYILIIFFILYNLWWTHQGHRGGLLRVGEMNRSYFWAVLGKFEKDERYEQLLDNDALYKGDPKALATLLNINFIADTTSLTTSIANKRLLEISPKRPFSPEFASALPPDKAKWLRAEATFIATQKEWDVWKMPQFIIKYYQGETLIQTNMVRVFRQMGDGETKTLTLDSRIPAESFDKITVLFWNAETGVTLFVQDLKLIAF